MTIAFYFLLFLYSNEFKVNFCFIIICKHLEVYTKRISRLGLGDYKPIFTEPKARVTEPEAGLIVHVIVNIVWGGGGVDTNIFNNFFHEYRQNIECKV